MTWRLGVATLAAAVLVPIASGAPPIADEPHTIAASFGLRSYAPGESAVLTLRPWVPGETVRIFRCGPPAPRSEVDDALSGVSVDGPLPVASPRIVLKVGTWDSGLYFARIEGPDSLAGFAPFVVRPRTLGLHPVAVVLPTNTWQAYNFRDSDHDGIGDTWYANPSIHSVDLTRPFLDRGVPPNFRDYNQGFIWWLGVNHKQVDFFADDDLARIRSGAELARLYDLVVFPGHEEYVTAHAYDVVQNFRDRGGNLLFLSANDFFYRVDLRGDRIVKRGHWSALGRDGERLTGLVYLGWSHNHYPNRPYVVTGARSAPWFFRGTGLHNGSTFGDYGIEIDHEGLRPPRSLITLARIPNDFGPGRSAEMTYYTTPAGAKVFSAGVMNFGGSAMWPTVSRLLENLWARTSKP